MTTACSTARLDFLIARLIGGAWTFAQLKAAQRRDGYVPTIHARTCRHGELVRGLRAAGLKVWTGSGFAR